MLQQLSTADIRSADKKLVLSSALHNAFCNFSTQFGSNSDGYYQGQLASLFLSGINIIKYIGVGPQSVSRKVQHIREDHDDNFIFYLPSSTLVRMRQGGKVSTATPGTFFFIPTNRPFFSTLLSPDSVTTPYDCTCIRVPGPILRKNFQNIDSYANEVFQFNSGSGRILGSLLESTMAEAPSIGERSLDNIQNALTGLIMAILSDSIEQHTQRRAELSVQQSKLEQALNYIRCHLSNPQLSTELIAREMGISLRQLHSLFSESEWTVAAYIREMRLLNVRDSLRHPQLEDTNIALLAEKWGFSNYANFSRLYKDRFGISPSKERKG